MTGPHNDWIARVPRATPPGGVKGLPSCFALVHAGRVRSSPLVDQIMKCLFAAIALSLLLVPFALAQPSEIHIIPRPEQMGSTHEGPFLLDRQVEIVSKKKE